jgi:hypothetical protein
MKTSNMLPSWGWTNMNYLSTPRDGQTYHTLWQMPHTSRGYAEKWHRSDTVFGYCQFPKLGFCLWFRGTVNLPPDPPSYFYVTVSTLACLVSPNVLLFQHAL